VSVGRRARASLSTDLRPGFSKSPDARRRRHEVHDLARDAGGVVEHDPATGRFHLPPEHAGFLTRAAGSDNLAVITQYIPVLASVEDDLVECFRRGGGVPYERFGRFKRSWPRTAA
jgi:hypothetical protein